MASLVLSLALAALVGFSLHRASLCTVRAVAEVLSTRRAYMFLSFLKTILWILAVTVPVIWLLPEASLTGRGWALSMYALAGGFMFGVGAAFNRGCAFSTLTRLGDGQLAMLFTLGGVCLGMSGYVFLAASLPPRTPIPISYEAFAPWSSVLFTVLYAWTVWEAVRLWLTRPVGLSWKALALSRQYRLSTAAALLGLSNGVLFALHGSWSYTNTFFQGIERLMGTGPAPSAVLLSLFAALLAGMGLSAWQRGSFRLDWRPSLSWARHLAGGFLMGLGAAITPGGNDVLILNSIPALSHHALPAYAAMILGVATVLAVTRLRRKDGEGVDCSGDVCTVKRPAK